MTAHYEVFISPNATVHHTVLIGHNSKIWQYSTLLEGACIGKDCNIGDCCSIGQRAVIGDSCNFQHGATIAAGTTVGNYVFLGTNVSILDCKLPNLARKHEEVHTPCVIEDHVIIGCGAVILPGVILHEGAVIGAGAVVVRDVKAGATVVGNPARERAAHRMAPFTVQTSRMIQHDNTTV